MTSAARMFIATAVLLAIGAASASQPADTARIGRTVDLALAQLGEGGALGSVDEPVSISRPASVRYELGAVVDAPAGAAAGLRVLAVTPGSAAQRLGLRPGDTLLAVNGARFEAGARTTQRLQQALAANGGQVEAQWSRGGRVVAARGQADVTAVPAYRMVIGETPAAGRCGFVSTRLGVPPLSRGIHDALITRIDGRSTPLLHRPNRYRLAAGRHVLVVDEMIRRDLLGSAAVREIARMRRARDAAAYKTLVLDVKPGTSYFVGARLVKERLDAQGIASNRYWEPVVYTERAEACR